jgi:hypothetical protein
MQKTIATLLAIASMMAGASAAMAQGSPESSLFAGFKSEERRIITDWFQDSNNTSGLPPALAKREPLAPGVQKQLTQNATLPPGLVKKIQPLPRALEIRLPRLPAGRRRVFVGGNVILLDESTSMIVDIISGVL